MIKPSSVAAVVLTLNEEVNIIRCLESVSWCDQIVVVDSGSNDNTLELAASYGADILVNRPDVFLFSEQRNFALDHGGIWTEWVLFLDADEVVTDRLRKRLTTTIEDISSEFVAYRLAPKFMFLGKWLRHCQPYPSWHDRLLRRGQARFGGGVWESFDTKGDIGYIDEPYLHYGFGNGLAAWYSRHNRYSDNEAFDIVTRLSSNTVQFGDYKITKRKHYLREITARLWPLRPFLRLFYTYVFRLGFLDGFPGIVYGSMMVAYEIMIVTKVLEARRRINGLDV